MRNFITNNKVKKILPFLFWMGVWWAVARTIGSEVLFPSPQTTFRTLGRLVTQQSFWLSTGATILRVFIGFSLAMIFGLFLGIICGLNAEVKAFFQPLMTTIRSTPVMSIILITLLWFEPNHVPIFIAFLMCFPIVWQNTFTGIRKVNSRLLQMATVYNVSKKSVLLNIYIPSLVPFLMAGFKTALGIGWKVTVAAEVLSHPKFSIGDNLYNSSIYIDTPSLFAWTFVVILLSYVIEVFLVNFLENRLAKYY